MRPKGTSTHACLPLSGSLHPGFWKYVESVKVLVYDDGESKDNERLAVKFRSHFTVSSREDGRRWHIQISSRKEKSHFLIQVQVNRNTVILAGDLN